MPGKSKWQWPFESLTYWLKIWVAVLGGIVTADSLQTKRGFWAMTRWSGGKIYNGLIVRDFEQREVEWKWILMLDLHTEKDDIFQIASNFLCHTQLCSGLTYFSVPRDHSWWGWGSIRDTGYWAWVGCARQALFPLYCHSSPQTTNNYPELILHLREYFCLQDCWLSLIGFRYSQLRFKYTWNTFFISTKSNILNWLKTAC